MENKLTISTWTYDIHGTVAIYQQLNYQWSSRNQDFFTSSKAGTLPPTRPVFPPCGTTARHLELQYLRI